MAMDEHAAAVLKAFCLQLRGLHTQAGGPSVDALAADPMFPLRRSQIYDVLKAKVVRPPSWDFVQAFIARCATYAAAHDRPLTISTDRDRWRTEHGLIENPHQQPRIYVPAPSGGAAAPVPAQLPAIAAPFTGRHRELDTLTVLWKDRDRAPVFITVITGSAAIGKTALAVRWSHYIRTDFPDGQLYVDLRGYDPQQPLTASEALAGFLTALGVAHSDLPATVDQRAAAFRTRVAHRRILVLLDNAVSAEQIRPLLPGTDTCAVVVTSRDRLPGLVSVNGAHRVQLGALPAPDATALLRNLIGRDGEPHAAVITLAALCCGIPLAIRITAELAIARPGALLTTLITELADTRQRLELLDSTGDPRSAMRAVFSWSYRHLAPESARAFRLIGIYPGPTITAESLAAFAGTPSFAAAHQLRVLTKASLADSTGEHAYRTHDLLRSYARTLAEETDSNADRQAAYQRLYHYYAGTAATADRILFAGTPDDDGVPEGPVTDAASARTWLDTEHDNIVRVAAHAADHGATDITTALSSSLWHYLYTGSHFDTALALHGHALHAARNSHDETTEAIALGNYANANWYIGRNDIAATHMREAHAIFHRLRDHVREATALGMLGVIAETLGQYDEATEYYTGSRTLNHQTGNLLGEALAIDNLGNIAYRRGNYATAIEHHEQALAIFAEIGDPVRQGICLSNTATVYRDQGHHHEALRCEETALALLEDIDNRAEQATARAGIGISIAALGEPHRGIEQIRLALQMSTDVGDLPAQGDRHAELGDALQIVGEHQHARDSHHQALQIAQQTGDRRLEAHALNGIATSHLAQRHTEEGAYLFGEAEQVAAEIGDLFEQARALYGLGHVRAARHDTVGAAGRWNDALEVATRLDIPLVNEITAAIAGVAPAAF